MSLTGQGGCAEESQGTLQFGLCIPCTKSPGPAGVESVWVGSGNSCPERPLNPFFTQVLLIIRASVVVNPSDGLQ